MIIDWISRLRTEHNDGSERAKRAPDQPRSADGTRSQAPLIDSDETLTGEFGRARRYEHTLAIVVATPVRLDPEDEGQTSSDGPPAAGGTDVLPLLVGAGLREALRESDVVCYRPHDRQFVLGLPQSDTEAARHAMSRVGALFRSRLRIELAAGAVHFPEDGLTLEDLVESARARAKAAAGEKDVSGSSGDGAGSQEAPTRRPVPTRPRRKPRAGTSRSIAHEAAGGE